MASLRKRYRPENSDKDAPVISTPSAGAELPPAAEKQPAEQPAVENAVRAAESSALKARLDEMTRAEGIVREAIQQQPLYATQPIKVEQEPEQPEQPPQTVEQIIASSGLPKRAQDWLLQHQDFVTDLAKNAQLQKMHHVAEYQSGDAFTDMYFERMEYLLGLKQAPQTNGHVEHRPVSAPAPRNPVRQPQRAAPPVSAPPTREVPSMSTGRAPTRRAPLTPAQREAARYSGISDKEYAEQLEKYEFQKSTGMHQQDH
jgi:hypothetical protein